MASKRMFSLQVVDTDAFLEMPLSSQALYFHLSMRADDDGFVSNPQKIMRMISASRNDYDILLLKRFIIPFDNGICVIKHWRINNYIQKDRYRPTTYTEQRALLEVKENGAYTLKKDDVYSLDTACIQNVSNLDTQNRLDKNRLDKNSIDKNNINILPDATSSTVPDEPIFISLSLISGKEYPITMSQVSQFQKLYTAVDVESELRKMQGWLLGNPKNRKTARGIMRFITNWLSRAQDKAKPIASKSSNPFLDDLKEMGGF